MTERQHIGNIACQTIVPNAQHTWLTEGLHSEFDTFIPMGTREAKARNSEAVNVIFQTYSTGISTGRDAWVCTIFNRNNLSENTSRIIENYNAEVARWTQRTDRDANLDDFVLSDNKAISWSRDLKTKLKRGRTAEYSEYKVRTVLYRPFTKSNLYFDQAMNDVVSVFPSIFPTSDTESGNRVICLTDKGSEKPFMVLMSRQVTDRKLVGSGCGTQCFPFYIYRRRQHKPPREHHRLGIGRVPNTLHKTTLSPSGTSSTITTDSCISLRIAKNTRRTSNAICHTYPLRYGLSGDSQKQANG